jgi:hypothetical protein
MNIFLNLRNYWKSEMAKGVIVLIIAKRMKWKEGIYNTFRSL